MSKNRTGPRAADLLSALRSRGVTHIAGLPDNSSAVLFDRVASGDAGIRLVPVTREGEAFAVAAGLWLGGARPAVVVQGTGLLESGDALRGTAVRMGVPLLVLITWRGWTKLAAGGLEAFGTPGSGAPWRRWPRPSREDLVRPDVDSVALLLAPTLDAWGVPWTVYGAEGDEGRVAAALDRAEQEERPVALLLPRPLT